MSVTTGGTSRNAGSRRRDDKSCGRVDGEVQLQAANDLDARRVARSSLLWAMTAPSGVCGGVGGRRS